MPKGQYAGNNGHVDSRLYDAGWIHDAYIIRQLSASSIAAELGVAKITVLRRLKSNGLARRPRLVCKRTQDYLGKVSGEKHPNFKQEKKEKLSGWGYRNIPLYGAEREGHRVHKNGCIGEHCYVMELFIGRALTSAECVHHLNFDKLDNRIENLVLFPNQVDHNLYHKYLERLGAYSLGQIAERPIYQAPAGTVFGRK